MKNEIILNFENGMPSGTAQEKGEAVRYKIKDGKKVAYIHHFKKPEVEAMRRLFELKLKRYRPEKPAAGPVSLKVILYFDIKERKLWGKYKTTRPDCDNYVKELKDAMTTVGFWRDDAQVVDLQVVKVYADKATIFIEWEGLDP